MCGTGAPEPARPPEQGRAPRLLAGEDLQIAKGDGDQPVQAYLAAMPGWKQAVGRRLDGLNTEVVPDARSAAVELTVLRCRRPWLVPQLPPLHQPL